jgi:cytochrome c oxidase subunit 2
MIPRGALQTVLDPAGSQAVHIHFVWLLFLWVSIAVYFTVVAFLGAAILRNVPNDAATDQSARAGRAVIAASVLTTIILFGLLAASAVKGHAISSLRPTDALKIRLTGHQWWWDAVYPTSDPSQEVTTANEIHIPVGRAVQLELASGDVIHSFWVPNLHGKTDLLPGKTTTIWLRADKPGVYRGQCAEFCGLQHAHMALAVFAESRDEFAAWYARQLDAAAEPTDAAQTRGRNIFLASCGVCHTLRGTEAGGRYGPDLTHVAARRTIAAGTLAFDRDSLLRWIAGSQNVKPGNNMPSFSLKADDLRAVVSYLEDLK